MTTQIDDPHSPFDTGAIPMTLELPSELKASQRKEHEMKEIAMPLRLEPEVKTAVEAVTKMLEAESSVLWGFSEIEPNKATLNCLLQYYALFGLLKTRYKIEQQWQSQTAKEKEGYEQILKFFFEHPEIDEATAEHFTQDDPAYRVVANRKDGITEEDIPPVISRYEASQHLAATEASLKAQREAVEAIKQALVADNAGEQTWRLLSLHQE